VVEKSECPDILLILLMETPYTIVEKGFSEECYSGISFISITKFYRKA